MNAEFDGLKKELSKFTTECRSSLEHLDKNESM
jgi:hypothetical protein